MGLRPLDPARWTRPAPAGELNRKAQLFDTRRSEVLASIDDPQVVPAARELVTRLVVHLAIDHPERFNDMDPLEAAGRMVSEDWCLVRPGDPPVLGAATVCSPNRWRLAEKIGRPITDIHAPVPGYRRRLGPPVDALFATRRGPTWRRNWSIQSSPSLFQPIADGPEHPRVPDELWVRSEFETLVRLPVSGWWVFGIHTTVRPLDDVRLHPGVATRVLTAITTLDSHTAAYKDVAAFRQPLTEWLAAVQ
jgi:hypothetical protein